MIDKDLTIIQTRKWISDVVAGCNFCPFAARELIRDTVRYSVIQTDDLEECLQALLNECVFLDANATTETSFLLFPGYFPNFLEYLDLVEMAESMIEKEDYEGIYQVASFHPNYQFEGSSMDDPANYTNRSPYPMLHLLREDSIEKALAHYQGDPEEIPVNNIKFAREKGLAYMKMLRDACLK